jgi:head-tail adaptor
MSIERATYTKSATGQDIAAWTTLDTVWAAVDSPPAEQQAGEKQEKIIPTYTITIRSYPILTTDRINWDGTILGITSAINCDLAYCSFQVKEVF